MKKFLVLIALCFGMSGPLLAANVLVVGVANLFPAELSATVDTIGDTLSASGHTVTKLPLTGPTTGQIAAALAGGSYDQVYLFDLGTMLLLDPADTAAIASFWNTNKGLVVDSRSYGYLYAPTNPSELALLRNVASAFVLTGGGLWIGVDDAPLWVHNANAVLNAIGADAATGNYTLPVNSADPSSVLLQGVTPSDLWVATVARAPLGIQPNGIEMFAQFGNDTGGTLTPYISASFPLSGPPVTAVPVDQPWALALLALAMAGSVGLMRRRRR